MKLRKSPSSRRDIALEEEELKASLKNPTWEKCAVHGVSESGIAHLK